MRLKHAFAAMAGTAIFAALMGSGYYRYNGIRERKELQAEFARADRLGLPTSVDEAWGPPVPAAQNAAPLYTRLSKREPAFRKANGEFKQLKDLHDPVQREKARAILTQLGDDLALFEKATAMPGCRFSRSLDLDARYPELNSTKTIVETVTAKAKLEAAAGDPLRAMATLQTAARASAHIAKEPILIAQLVAIKMQEDATKAAQAVLQSGGNRADVRDAARRMVEAFGPLPSFKRAMQGEWVSYRRLLADLDSGKVQTDQFFGEGSENSQEAARVRGAMGTPGGRARQELFMVRHFLSNYEALPTDPSDVRGTQEAFRSIDPLVGTKNPDGVLASLMLPVFGGGGEISGISLANRRVLLALLAALESPTPPKHLPVKGPDSLDPFTGRPLLYLGKPNEIRVWSVGQDGKDDGGLVRRTADHEDITAQWVR